MDDVSKLGPLWVSQLTREVTSHRNRAAENLLTIKPEGSFAAQHRLLIDAANAMIAAPALVTALQDCIAVMERELNGLAVIQPELRAARAALAAAGAA